MGDAVARAGARADLPETPLVRPDGARNVPASSPKINSTGAFGGDFGANVPGVAVDGKGSFAGILDGSTGKISGAIDGDGTDGAGAGVRTSGKTGEIDGAGAGNSGAIVGLAGICGAPGSPLPGAGTITGGAVLVLRGILGTGNFPGNKVTVPAGILMRVAICNNTFASA